MHSIRARRLFFQSLARPRFTRAVDVVEWLGAVQAQDFAGAKWAVAQRMTGATESDLDRAFDNGSILRTHVLRPTWHLVLPKDIRWMLTLTAPRVYAAMAYRSLGLDLTMFARCQRLLAKELAGGQAMTRQELSRVVGHTAVRLGVVLISAELDGVVCSGPLRGKQHTWALLDERVREHHPLGREECLALLARRYFRSHGPATLKDFRWWSGLSMADSREAVANAGSGLASETIDGQTYWLSTSPARQPRTGQAYLLPNFDEYLVAYADRRAAYNGSDRLTALRNTVVVDGRVVGIWRRTLSAGTVTVEVTPIGPIGPLGPLARAVERYGAFLGRAANFQV